MDFFTTAFNLIATLTALLIVNGLVSSVIRCWQDVTRKTAAMTPEALETAQIIAEVSEALLASWEPTEYGVEVIESLDLTEKTTELEIDPWIMPQNQIECAIATIKAKSQKPEIMLLAAPKPLTVTQINKMKKAELEAECKRWNVETGIVKVMKDNLKAVAVF